MDMAKKWKYEADCKRIEALIEETAAEGKQPGWGHCAMKVLLSLRIVRPKSTPLALHFVSTSATEMLSKRHDNAKLCLLTAMTLANPRLMDEQLRTFAGEFASKQCPPGCPDCAAAEAQASKMSAAIHNMIQSLGGKLAELPEGVSTVELAPGMKAQVIKVALDQQVKAALSGKTKKKKVKKLPSGLPASHHPMTGDPRLN